MSAAVFIYTVLFDAYVLDKEQDEKLRYLKCNIKKDHGNSKNGNSQKTVTSVRTT